MSKERREHSCSHPIPVPAEYRCPECGQLWRRHPFIGPRMDPVDEDVSSLWPTPASHQYKETDMAKTVGPNEAETIWHEQHPGAAEKWTAKDVGDSLTGHYLGFTTITLDDGSEIRYHEVRDDHGDLWSVTDSAQIKKCFEGVEPGVRVKLVFKGTIDLGRPGHSPMKNYALFVAQ